MKFQVFAVILFVAGAFALPQAGDEVIIVESSNELSQRNPVEDSIRRTLERISARIQSAGLDPLEVEKREFEFIPVTIDLVVRAFVENVRFAGLSNIHIHTLDYNYIFSRLRIDVSLPEIVLTIGDSGLDALVLGAKVEGAVSGSLSIKSIRLAGEVYVNANVIGQITLRSLSVNFSLGGIDADVNLSVQGTDRSEGANNLLNNRIPNFFENNKDDINKVLEDVISFILNVIWSA